MSTAQNIEPQDGPRIKEMKCGTLTYTKVTITVLFAWLLWGDFCFTLMEAVVPTIVPLKLQQLGCSSTLLAVITGTIPAILNLIVCPWVSFKSDRHRSKLGRRIPFILYTIPFLCISLVLMGWSPEIATFLRTWIPFFKNMAPASLTIGVIAIFLIVFSFFNLFVNSVYWYLFNDVVPGHMLGRFTSLFRIVGNGAGFMYNVLIFPLGLTHTREIMTGAAILYFIGFGLMCFFVKEGEYPPHENPNEKHVGPIQEFIANIKIYANESFRVRFYWYFYLSQAFFAMLCCVGMFSMFQQIELGLNLTQMGNMNGFNMLIGIVALYFAAIYVDRWHPMRVLAYMSVIGALGAFNGGWQWLFMTMPSNMYFWVSFANGVVGVFAGSLYGVCLLPAMMRLMPKSRYGQLSSAYSMIRSVGAIVGSFLAGISMDATLYLCQHFGHSATYGYRWIFVWGGFFSICTTICYALAYRKWQELGGDKNYKAPAPWNPSGFEEVNDNTPSIPCNPKLLMRGLHLNTVTLILTILAAPLFLYATSHQGAIHIPLPNLESIQWTIASWKIPWHIPIKPFDIQMHQMPVAEMYAKYLYIPFMVLVLAGWLRLVYAIKRDLKIVLAGGQPRLGIPHHGVLIVLGIQGVFAMGVAWAQYLWMIDLNMEHELMIVGLVSIIGYACTAGGYHLLRLLEKGPNQQDRIAMPHNHPSAPEASAPGVS